MKRLAWLLLLPLAGSALFAQTMRPTTLPNGTVGRFRQSFRSSLGGQLIETNDPYGPFGAKEASEGALAGFPPALVAAIADALGVDIDTLPVTPDRIIDALPERRGRARWRR